MVPHMHGQGTPLTCLTSRVPLVTRTMETRDKNHRQTEQLKCNLPDRSANPVEKLGSSPAERVFMHRRVKGCPLWCVFPSPESQLLSRWRLQVPRVGEVASLPAYQGQGGFNSEAKDNG